MIDLSELVIFTIVSNLLLEILHITISYFIPVRQNINSYIDQSTVDSTMKIIQKSYIYSTSHIQTTHQRKPIGFIIGKYNNGYYLAYIALDYTHKHDTISFDIKLYSTKPFMQNNEICTTDIDSYESIDNENDHKYINVYRKYGIWKGKGYKKTKMKVIQNIATTEQEYVVNEIHRMIELSKMNGYVYGGVFLVIGETGVGKSYLGRLLANRINGSLCDEFDLTKPGNDLYGLLDLVEPTYENPIIVMIDELDKSIIRIDEENIQEHKYMRIPCVDKDSWNRFIDQIHDIDNVVIIMTTNRTVEWYMDKDSSYVRKGRINQIFHMTQNKISLADTSNQHRFEAKEKEL